MGDGRFVNIPQEIWGGRFSIFGVGTSEEIAQDCPFLSYGDLERGKNQGNDGGAFQDVDRGPGGLDV